MEVELCFEDIASRACYSIASFLSVRECRMLRATSKCVRASIPESVQNHVCKYSGSLKWISGHEPSFLDGHIHSAKYNGIKGLACSDQNVLLVADTHNGVLRGFQNGKANVLTQRDIYPFAVFCQGTQVFLARALSIECINIQRKKVEVLKYKPVPVLQLPLSSAPYSLCISDQTFFITTYSPNLVINDVELEIRGSLLAGLCPYQHQGDLGVLVCDVVNDRILFVTKEGKISVFLSSIHHPCHLTMIKSTLFVAGTETLYEFRHVGTRPERIEHSLSSQFPDCVQPRISAMTATPDGTLVVSTYSYIFAFI